LNSFHLCLVNILRRVEGLAYMMHSQAKDKTRIVALERFRRHIPYTR